ncbi:MAG: hypothetical protein PCALPYG88_4266 [uncultured Paraburkholderia sp.]|uniref:hypothetical protein n=1 Tax=uncultured Paraburkholderia sp. TaxID=1822466 RepID=UPI002591E0A0|nr:hypothetical protein [uncultured Paraburkholderia sp.]CAH2900334.1 MAG: hypothetical protein PCALPYG08_4669 [uncultured Paraburkholderia sp.]CAH2928682.1 MAG: hypothetical protein PCALPYG88_4266 [uncultured Paraburkholderia sp.]
MIALYLIAILACATGAVLYMSLGLLPPAFADVRVGLMCAAIGAVGGCLYCLRAVYVNRCVRKSWSTDWHCWYFLRPITSIVCGGVSFLFLKAGLLVLESGTKNNASEIGFYALAFIAGLNVDKFVGKIEDVAQAVWGIDKSRSRTDVDEKDKKEKSDQGSTGQGKIE